MARTPSISVQADPEAEVVGGTGGISDRTQVSLTIGTQIAVVTTIIALTFGAAAAWFTTKADIAESKAQTAAVRDLVVAYISDSNKKWEQYAIDRESDRSETRKWREELRDAVRTIHSITPGR